METCLVVNNKLTDAHTRIQDVHLIMQKNVKTIIENSDEVNRMDEGSSRIKETAFNVQSQSRALEEDAKKR